MNDKIMLCPTCNANYPPATHELLKHYLKCLFCDTTIHVFLSKQVPADAAILLEPLPSFPNHKIDLEKYQVTLPFAQQYASKMHLPSTDRIQLEFIVKLELIRAQILAEVAALQEQAISS